MGLGLGRGLGENAQGITPGGLGLGRGLWGLGFKPDMGRGKRTDMAGCVWPKINSRWPTAMLKKLFFTIKLTFFFHFLPHSTTSSIHLQFFFYKTKKCILTTVFLT
ncbi:hypothetical protein HanXRQr2_Chr12g0556751 [Helianthus annuus]|uniref:Uncharacterized protein n=2 Tax=Helianthus annuus TaxID=4232 RepID=A0A9K3HJ37_HELAN|nr:hypothetical protein HanXRQr2_Chr12g0556751 [Helianthus annuus]KAJ0490512.1 hypothetical protein HanHA300_Chr12g0456301 [Helianthus annuus]KAJ0494752.1 hypothetical protein HanIR_Chr12g0601021 [Helianthus annuus]KAJ0506429.1 hypothetical protein HanHA89_Chr12g0481861 [Helianthus annuus]KAJ0676105.1 hypothetical protein HanLR1_Chr12g0458841 [Helianthus annuus]